MSVFAVFKEAVDNIDNYLELAELDGNVDHRQLACHVLGRTYWLWAETKREQETEFGRLNREVGQIDNNIEVPAVVK